MIARPFLLVAALAAVASFSGCDTISGMTSWLPNIGSSNAPAFEVAQDKPSLAIQFHGVVLQSAKADENGTEIALELDHRADAAEFADVQRRAPDWILGTHTDGNMANIVARSAADLSAEPTADGFILKIVPRTVAVALPDDADAMSAQEDPLIGMQRESPGAAFGVAETSPTEEPPRGSL